VESYNLTQKNGFKKWYISLKIVSIFGKVFKAVRINKELSQEELAFRVT